MFTAAAFELSLLGSFTLNVSLTTRSTVRRHLNFDVAGTNKEVGVLRSQNSRSALL